MERKLPVPDEQEGLKNFLPAHGRAAPVNGDRFLTAVVKSLPVLTPVAGQSVDIPY